MECRKQTAPMATSTDRSGHDQTGTRQKRWQCLHPLTPLAVLGSDKRQHNQQRRTEGSQPCEGVLHRVIGSSIQASSVAASTLIPTARARSSG